MPIAEEQEVIRAATALKATRNYGVVRELNRLGYRDRDGAEWTKDTLRQVFGVKRRKAL